MTAADKSYFDSKFKTLHDKVDRVERGVHGDKENGHIGLIQKDQDKEERLKTMEDRYKRMVWIAAGIAMATVGIEKFLVFILNQIKLL